MRLKACLHLRKRAGDRASVRSQQTHRGGCLHLRDDVVHYFYTFLYVVDRHIYFKTRVLEGQSGVSVKFIFQHPRTMKLMRNVNRVA